MARFFWWWGVGGWRATIVHLDNQRYSGIKWVQTGNHKVMLNLLRWVSCLVMHLKWKETGTWQLATSEKDDDSGILGTDHKSPEYLVLFFVFYIFL